MESLRKLGHKTWQEGALIMAALVWPSMVEAAPKPLKITGVYCCWDGSSLDKQIFEFDSLDEAKQSVDKICQHVGIQPKFELRAANVPTAVAVIEGKTRLILYNPVFIRKLNAAAKTDWASLSVLAHEIGHHVNGHTLDNGGSRPELELEADQFSGFVLQKMGATLHEACAAVKTLPRQGTETHPPGPAREVAIATGWMSAEKLAKIDPAKPTETVPEEKPRVTVATQGPPAPPPPAPPRYVARIVVPSDVRTFLLMSSGEVVFIDPTTGVSGWYGMRETARDPVTFEWDLVSGDERFGVTRDGQLFRFRPGVQPIRMGYVTTL